MFFLRLFESVFLGDEKQVFKKFFNVLNFFCRVFLKNGVWSNEVNVFFFSGFLIILNMLENIFGGGLNALGGILNKRVVFFIV